jgi:LysR family transcriptional regulator, regulator for metE and metH
VPARIDEVQLTEAIIELVKAGLGVAALARWAVEPVVKSGALIARSLTTRGQHRRWSAVMPKDLAKADFVREFTDLLIEYAPGQAQRVAKISSLR